jgi:hypothetical protein
MLLSWCLCPSLLDGSHEPWRPSCTARCRCGEIPGVLSSNTKPKPEGAKSISSRGEAYLCLTEARWHVCNCRNWAPAERTCVEAVEDWIKQTQSVAVANTQLMCFECVNNLCLTLSYVEINELSRIPSGYSIHVGSEQNMVKKLSTTSFTDSCLNIIEPIAFLNVKFVPLTV